MPRRRLRVATRGSTLARTQTALVAGLLGADVEVVVVETTGDRHPDVPIPEIAGLRGPNATRLRGPNATGLRGPNATGLRGPNATGLRGRNGMGGQGVFVKEVQAAVLDGRADIAVHSAKDLPSSPTPGLVIAAVPERADPRDAIVGAALDDLPPGGLVGTGSIRRRIQLAWIRPDLTFGTLRGNMETRLAKGASFDAIVVAAAALARLDRLDEAAQILGAEVMVPQVGQGALAVECRADDEGVRDRLRAIDHAPSHSAVDAERAFLREIGGACDLPVGAYAVSHDGGGLSLTGLVGSPDGRVVLRHAGSGHDPSALGRDVARYLLEDGGGAALLGDLAPERV